MVGKQRLEAVWVFGIGSTALPEAPNGLNNIYDGKHRKDRPKPSVGDSVKQVEVEASPEGTEEQ